MHTAQNRSPSGNQGGDDRDERGCEPTIVQSTPGGYRAADARFLAGEIFFYQNNTAEALRWWRDITPGSGDSYATAYSELLAELHAPSGLSAAKVNAALGGERRRWLEFSRKRLRQFGYTFTSF